MLPIEIRSLSDDVSETPLGIREPAQGVPIPVANIDLVVVPGLGFDRDGNRIGRGRGFYDRFLAHRDFQGTSCALALEEQVVDHVPSEDMDVQVDMLVTDTEIRRFSQRAASK
jgi:5-formyltetrahydrofolate cyclo-ligase